jgi:multidrug/hemolysin transport system ATP-binding protein
LDKIIEVENLKKYFDEIKAVDDISFYTQRGQLFAFLGTNGAGKSTTIDMLCSLLKPDSGNVKIDGLTLGKDDAKIREEIGIVFQDSVLDSTLTVRENLETRARFYGSDNISGRVIKAAESADAFEFIDRPYGKLSGGQKRRADIARALINTPKILFLDEPTTGLDPKTRKNVWNTISKLQKDFGVTVFLTTHYMEEAAEADYVVVIGNGKILAKGTPFDLKAKYSFDSLKIKTSDTEKITNYLNKSQLSYNIKNEIIIIPLKETKQALAILKDNENLLEGFEVIAGTMDDAFINITGGDTQNV